MKFKRHRWGIWFLLGFCTHCHVILPYSESKSDQPQGIAIPDATFLADQPSIGTHDSGRQDQTISLPDHQDTMDVQSNSDVSIIACKSLLAEANAIQLSVDDEDLDPQATPSIVVYADGFAVAFVESNQIKVRRLDANGKFLDHDSLSKASNASIAAAAPRITKRPDTDELAMVWQEKTKEGAENCLSQLILGVTEVANWPNWKSCKIFDFITSTDKFAYGPASLAFDALGLKKYLIAVPVDVGGKAESCTEAHQTIYFVATQAPDGNDICNPQSIAIDGEVLDPYNSFNPIFLPPDPNSLDYILMRQVDPQTDGNGSQHPAKVSNRFHSTNNTEIPNWSGMITSTTLGEGPLNRPALVSANAGTFVAWTEGESPALSIQIAYRSSKDSLMSSAVEAAKNAQDPFLAYNPSKSVVALSFTEIDNGGSSQAISLVMLNEHQNDLIKANSKTIVVHNTSTNPRSPAMAPSPNGFGIVWIDDSQGKPEVFFKNVICQPGYGR